MNILAAGKVMGLNPGYTLWSSYTAPRPKGMHSHPKGMYRGLPHIVHVSNH